MTAILALDVTAEARAAGVEIERVAVSAGVLAAFKGDDSMRANVGALVRVVLSSGIPVTEIRPGMCVVDAGGRAFVVLTTDTGTGILSPIEVALLGNEPIALDVRERDLRAVN